MAMRAGFLLDKSISAMIINVRSGSLCLTGNNEARRF